MKPTEAAALLTIAAAFDNRKPDADQAKAWALALHDLRFEDCREIVIEHYRRTREWLMPSNVVDGVKRMRSDRIRLFGALPEPPPECADDSAAYSTWYSETLRRIADGEPVARPAAIEAASPEHIQRLKALLAGTREMPNE